METDFYSILACPVCKSKLKADSYGTFLHCAHCDARYPIREGIPDLRVIEKKEQKNKLKK